MSGKTDLDLETIATGPTELLLLVRDQNGGTNGRLKMTVEMVFSLRFLLHLAPPFFLTFGCTRPLLQHEELVMHVWRPNITDVFPVRFCCLFRPRSLRFRPPSLTWRSPRTTLKLSALST
eukprot:2228695-Rhodomonas_salina.2